jgi:hypothetical protein
LSGKPLDPESAAAKPYLKGWTPKSAVDQGPAPPPKETAKVAPKSTTPKEPKKPRLKKEDETTFYSNARSDYVKNRPLRQRKSAFDPIAVAMQGLNGFI